MAKSPAGTGGPRGPRRLKLDSRHVTILLVIHAFNPPLRELARLCGLAVGTARYHVDRLRESGFLEQDVGRQVARHLTPAGLDLISGFCLAR